MKTSFFLKSESMSEPHEASANLLESFGELPGLPRALCDSTEQLQTCPCSGGRGRCSRPPQLLLLHEPLIPWHLSCWRESGHVKHKHPVGGGKQTFPFVSSKQSGCGSKAITRLVHACLPRKGGRGQGGDTVNTDGWCRELSAQAAAAGQWAPLRRPPGLLSPFFPQ